jgi:hypothetical protein
MKELDTLDTCLRDLLAAVRAAYQPTLAHDALVRAAIAELTALEEAQPVTFARASTPSIVPMALGATPPPVTVRAVTEQAIVDILRAGNGQGRITDAFDHKESQLRTLFCSLRPLEALALGKRLSDSTDKLAEVFSRFAPERRLRLLGVLADARRREALQQARGRVAQGASR